MNPLLGAYNDMWGVPEKFDIDPDQRAGAMVGMVVGVVATRGESAGPRMAVALEKTAVEAGMSGSFSSLKGLAGDGLTPHHMPQAALEFTGYKEGGALVLSTAEHYLTRTFGGKGARTAVSDAGLSFREVLAKDIKDIRSFSGSKYNEGLRNLIKYYEENFPHLMAK
jgi:hypothetical protein